MKRLSYALTISFLISSTVIGINAIFPKPALSQETSDVSSIDPSQANDPTSKLELRLFDFTYKSDSEDERLKRLENFVFGQPQTGTDSQRIARIEQSVTASASTATSAPNVTNARPTDNQRIAPAQAEANSSAKQPFDGTDYPRVDQLEQQILGKKFSEETLPQRLSRLETKAFGHPSTSNDLASRVDALDSYASRNDIYGEQNRLVQKPQYSPLAQMTYAPTTQAPTPNSYFQPNVTSTNDRVAAMEKAVFGHENEHHSLQDRVEKLEKKVIPYKHGQESQSLPIRVDQLWSILNVANTLNSSPIAANPSNANFDQSNYSPQSKALKPHHSWLHAVGKVLETAAMTAASSGMMGMGGYPYGGYGYGGYPGYNGIGGF